MVWPLLRRAGADQEGQLQRLATRGADHLPRREDEGAAPQRRRRRAGRRKGLQKGKTGEETFPKRLGHPLTMAANDVSFARVHSSRFYKRSRLIYVVKPHSCVSPVCLMAHIFLSRCASAFLGPELK